MRVALYWTPEPDDPLLAAGNAWLGRNAETGAPVAQPALTGIAEATAAPRLYGFHATLRPPMRLATGWDAFLADARRLAACTVPFALPTLAVGAANGFVALHAASPCPALHAFADACVRETEAHRLPAGEAELAGRRSAGLSATQEWLLLRWGYPHVMHEWRFHMTLSEALAEAEAARLRAAAATHFDGILARDRAVQSVCVFTQAEAGAAFLIAERLPLGS